MCWRIQHCQNRHFETICSGNGSISPGPLEKIRAPLYTSWKLKYKFPRGLVELWMYLSLHQQQRYETWHLPDEFKLRHRLYTTHLFLRASFTTNILPIFTTTVRCIHLLLYLFTFIIVLIIVSEASYAFRACLWRVVGLWIRKTCRAVTKCDILSKGGPKTCSTLA